MDKLKKLDFINWLLNYYNVSDGQFATELHKYNNGLTDKIDFNKLKDYVMNTYSLRPGVIELNKVSTIYKFFVFVDNDSDKCSALKYYDYLKKTSCNTPMSDFPEDLKEKIRQTLNKYGIKPCFDK